MVCNHGCNMVCNYGFNVVCIIAENGLLLWLQYDF